MSNDGELPVELSRCREEIENIDREIIDLLRRRLDIAQRTGELKREHGLPILDPQREAKVVRSAVANARDAGLPEEPVREIFWHILGLSRKAQQTHRE
ncbi:MAG TPA: chorismate mutase [Gemmatimonadaceae bacterium]|jgi:chorismate mutase/prephenate dehydrogenase|nr:chorismate mutase [Gemmatimonadaceae bacterium]